MDGASSWGRFWHVTLPLLKPVLAVVILFSTIFTFGDFNIVQVLTRGRTDQHDPPLRHARLPGRAPRAATSARARPSRSSSSRCWRLVVFFQLRYIRKE